jgi:hypothetical protein
MLWECGEVGKLKKAFSPDWEFQEIPKMTRGA